jgi:hypothetical protein
MKTNETKRFTKSNKDTIHSQKLHSQKLATHSFLFVVMTVLSIVAIIFSSNVSASEYNMNITSTITSPKDAALVATSLKYEPYPINAGDWFDIWVKVQNIGEEDAPHAVFMISPEYPFYVEDNKVQDYGILDGEVSALKHKLADETDSQSNQIVIKYRIGVANNASEGISKLKLLAGTDGLNDTVSTFEFPIMIKKTKTDFDASFKSYNQGRLVFEIANIGEKNASAVTVVAGGADKKIVSGQTSFNIGNLQPGDFTTVSFDISPALSENESINNFILDISYTDEAGNRITTTRAVATEITSASLPETSNGSSIRTVYDNKYIFWIFGIAGIVVGIIIAMLFTSKRKRD